MSQNGLNERELGSVLEHLVPLANDLPNEFDEQVVYFAFANIAANILLRDSDLSDATIARCKEHFVSAIDAAANTLRKHTE